MTARLGSHSWDDVALVIEFASRDGHHVPGTPEEWRHGWDPLTEGAAKSHGGGKVPKGWKAPQGNERPVPTHAGLYHATSAANAASIRREGFRANSGSGQNGAFFGAGTYFHTRESDARESLEGYRAYIDSSMEHVRANATVRNPFTVHATGRDHSPGQVMQRELAAQGVTKPGERLTPSQVTARLKSLGYDGVEVKQDGFNHDIGGNQLIVFDPSKIQVVGNGKPVAGDELWNSGEGRLHDVTPGEAAAMKQWWYGPGHQFTNAYLRGRPNALYPDEKAGIALVTGLVNRAPAFTRPVLLHRGVMNASHPDLFGPVGSKVGKVFTDPGLMSTTADESMARNGYSREAAGKALTVLHVHAPAGSRALRADPALDGDFNDIDKEYTFPAGTRLRVTGDRLAANPEIPGQVRHIDVTVEPQ